jgi:hypothetical protein
MNGKARAFAIALCMAAILVLACVPAASAGHAQKAEGTWTWVPSSFDTREVDGGSQYAVGDEEGTWVGTFTGRSHDDFAGVIPPDGSIGGALTVVFHGRVNHARGTMVMFLTWWAPYTSLFMDGTWEIVYTSGGLEHLRGSGTWVSLLDKEGQPTSAADYSGKLWRD